jgi:hypothetical protein
MQTLLALARVPLLDKYITEQKNIYSIASTKQHPTNTPFSRLTDFIELNRESRK